MVEWVLGTLSSGSAPLCATFRGGAKGFCLCPHPPPCPGLLWGPEAPPAPMGSGLPAPLSGSLGSALPRPAFCTNRPRRVGSFSRVPAAAQQAGPRSKRGAGSWVAVGMPGASHSLPSQWSCSFPRPGTHTGGTKAQPSLTLQPGVPSGGGVGGGIRTLILRQLQLAPLQAGTGSGDRFFLSTWDCDPQDDPPAEFTQTPELGPPRARPQHRRFWVSPGRGAGPAAPQTEPRFCCTCSVVCPPPGSQCRVVYRHQGPSWCPFLAEFLLPICNLRKSPTCVPLCGFVSLRASYICSRFHISLTDAQPTITFNPQNHRRLAGTSLLFTKTWRGGAGTCLRCDIVHHLPPEAVAEPREGRGREGRDKEGKGGEGKGRALVASCCLTRILGTTTHHRYIPSFTLRDPHAEMQRCL